MKIFVLLVNYDGEAQKLYAPLLDKHGIIAHTLSTMLDALIKLSDEKYECSCVVINGDNFEYLPLLKVMRKLTTSPIGVSVTHYNPKENNAAIIQGADIFRVRYDEPAKRVERFSAFLKFVIDYRQNYDKPSTVIACGDLQLFPQTRKVYVKSTEIVLLTKEFDILYLLMKNKGIALSYQTIFLRVWGEDYDENVKERLWNQINRLRNKLQIFPDQPEYIANQRNYGYRFDPKKKK